MCCTLSLQGKSFKILGFLRIILLPFLHTIQYVLGKLLKFYENLANLRKNLKLLFDNNQGPGAMDL